VVRLSVGLGTKVNQRPRTLINSDDTSGSALLFVRTPFARPRTSTCGRATEGAARALGIDQPALPVDQKCFMAL